MTKTKLSHNLRILRCVIYISGSSASVSLVTAAFVPSSYAGLTFLELWLLLSFSLSLFSGIICFTLLNRFDKNKVNEYIISILPTTTPQDVQDWLDDIALERIDVELPNGKPWSYMHEPLGPRSHYVPIRIGSSRFYTGDVLVYTEGKLYNKGPVVL